MPSPVQDDDTRNKHHRSASDLDPEVKRRAVAHRSASHYIEDFTKKMKTEIAEAYPEMSASDHEDIVDLAFSHSNILETVEDVLRQNEELVKRFAGLKAAGCIVKLKPLSSLKTQDAVRILGSPPDQVDVLDSTSTYAALQSFVVTRRGVPQDFGNKFDRYWLERGESLQNSLRAVCEIYGDLSESRARTVVEFHLRDLAPFLKSLGQKILLFPEVTVAIKARGPMTVVSGKHAYLLTGSIDILAISTAIPEVSHPHMSVRSINPSDIQTPEASQLTDMTSTMEAMTRKEDLFARFVPIELKKLGAQLVEHHLAQVFFETAASMQATDQKYMSFVLSDGETWVLGCVCRDAGEDGRGYDCYFTKPYTVPLSTNGDFSGQLETLMKMLGLLLSVNADTFFKGLVHISYNT